MGVPTSQSRASSWQSEDLHSGIQRRNGPSAEAPRPSVRTPHSSVHGGHRSESLAASLADGDNSRRASGWILQDAAGAGRRDGGLSAGRRSVQTTPQLFEDRAAKSGGALTRSIARQATTQASQSLLGPRHRFGGTPAPRCRSPFCETAELTDGETWRRRENRLRHEEREEGSDRRRGERGEKRSAEQREHLRAALQKPSASSSSCSSASSCSSFSSSSAALPASASSSSSSSSLKAAAQREATLRYLPSALLREISDSISQDPLLAKVADRGEEDAYLSLRFFVCRERGLPGDAPLDAPGQPRVGGDSCAAAARNSEATASNTRASDAVADMEDGRAVQSPPDGGAARARSVEDRDDTAERPGVTGRHYGEGTGARARDDRGDDDAVSDGSGDAASKGFPSVLSASKDLVFVWYRRRGSAMRLCIPRLPELLWKVVAFFFFLSPSPFLATPSGTFPPAPDAGEKTTVEGGGDGEGERGDRGEGDGGDRGEGDCGDRGGGDRREGERSFRRPSSLSWSQKKNGACGDSRGVQRKLSEGLHAGRGANAAAGRWRTGGGGPGELEAKNREDWREAADREDAEGKKTLLRSVAAYVYWPGMQSFFDTCEQPGDESFSSSFCSASCSSASSSS
ncbi:hypothetical protein TGP89_217770A, partial [Toxoplasma gondii p89]